LQFVPTAVDNFVGSVLVKQRQVVYLAAGLECSLAVIATERV
jgi:hypothetical protein